MGGDDGLECYRQIAYQLQTRSHLISPSGGIVALEIGFQQAEKVKRIFEQVDKLQFYELHQDLQHQDRCLVFRSK